MLRDDGETRRLLTKYLRLSLQSVKRLDGKVGEGKKRRECGLRNWPTAVRPRCLDQGGLDPLI